MENHKNPDRTRVTSIAGRSKWNTYLTLVKNLAFLGLLGATPLRVQSASVFDVVPNTYLSSPALGYSAALSQPIRSQQLYPATEFPAATVRITALRWRRYSSQTFSSASGQFRFKLSTTSKSENNLSSIFSQNVGPNETIVFDGTWNVSSPTPDNVAPYPFEMVLNLTTPFDYNPTQGNLLLEHQCFSTSIPVVDGAGDVGDGLARAYNLNLDPNGTTASVVDTGGEIIQFEYTMAGPTLTHVVPIGLESTEGNYYSGTMREPLLRQQTVYAAANFPSSTLHITELRFRRDISEPPFVNASATATVKLSTTSRGTGNMSATFADNSGPDEITVFNGVWNYSTPTVVGPGIVRPFEIILPLTTPFTYNPAAGNLLFDIKITGGTGGSWTDGASGGSSQVARVLSLNPNATVGNVGELTGDVIQLVYEGEPPTFSVANAGVLSSDQHDSAGASWGDVNGDGLEDLFVVNFNQQSAMYMNNGNGTFSKALGIAPVQNVASGIAASMADIENDGDLDLFVANQGNDRLYRNNGNGTWTDLAGDPIGQDGLVSSGGAWGDYDEDGFVDLAVAMGGGAASIQNRLYRNLGNGSFALVTSGAVAQSTGYNISASWADYDNDNDLDLLLTGDNLLFRNNGAGSFTGVTSTPISSVSGFPFGGGWADYDNDGDLDLLIVNLFESPRLYRNDGGGTFAQLSITAFAGAYAGSMHWGDFDLDGYIDVAMAGRSGPPRVFRNDGTGGFLALQLPGVPADGYGNGISWVDYDNDGDLDLFVARGGDTGSINNQTNLLLNNAGNANGWLEVKLNGSLSNRKGVGAKVWATAQIGGVARQQLRQLGGGDSYGGNSLIAHFGLGDASTISELKIEWPSGLVQTLNGISINQRITINEGDVPVGLSFQPAGGTFTNSVQVTIQSPVGGGTIRYTTDGNDPTASSTAYTGPFALTQTATVKARLYVNGFPASEVATATYTRYIPPDIQFVPSGQLFTNQLNVALVNNVGAGSTIRYTLNGSTPTSTSTAYVPGVPVNLTAGATITAQVYFGNFFVSDVFTETYARVYAFGNDGVPFAWREQYFGPNYLTNPCAAADADCDGDSYTVVEEYQHGTNPTVMEIILSMRAVPRLTFSTIPGESYQIQRTTTLDPADWQIIVPSIQATGPELHYVDELAPDHSYYRIEQIQN